MSFHEVVKNSIFGSISDSNVTSTLVLGGFIFTICQFLITFVQPAPYGRYTNSSPSYLTCMFLIFMPISFHQGWPKTKWPIVWIDPNWCVLVVLVCDMKREKEAFWFLVTFDEIKRALQKSTNRKYKIGFVLPISGI